MEDMEGMEAFLEKLCQGSMLALAVRAGLRLQEAVEVGLRGASVGVTPQALQTLLTLRCRGPGTCAFFARVLQVRPQSMDRVLRELARAGLVTREGEPGRRHLWFMTVEGAEVLGRGLAVLKALEERYFGGIDEPTRASVEFVLQHGASTAEHARRGTFDHWELLCRQQH